MKNAEAMAFRQLTPIERDLAERLRGRYPVGINAEFGVRQFQVMAIQLEAAAALERLTAERNTLREALEMVRDADDDCRRDGLSTLPVAARAQIDDALAHMEVAR